MGSIGGFVLEWSTPQMVTSNTPYLANDRPQALYNQPSGLGPTYDYIVM